MAEALSFSEAAAARELQAAQRNAARRQQFQAELAAAEEEELAALESEEQEAAAARQLAAGQRRASRGKGSGGGNDLALVTDTAGEITDLITAVIEIETIIVPLILLANYHVRFLSGNLGVLPEAGGPLSFVLDKSMELASAGAKTAGKTAGSATARSAGTSAAGSASNPTGGTAGKSAARGANTAPADQRPASTPIGNIFDVKKLAIWQIFLLITLDGLIALIIVVNLLVFFAVPIILLGGAAGLVVGFCIENPDICSTAADLLGDLAPAVGEALGDL